MTFLILVCEMWLIYQHGIVVRAGYRGFFSMSLSAGDTDVLQDAYYNVMWTLDFALGSGEVTLVNDRA